MKITVNGDPRTCSDNLTIEGLLSGLHVPLAAVAVEVNRQIVPRARHSGHRLEEGDVVEVVTFVGGG